MCSPSAPSVPTSTTQTTIPEYAQPTAERLVGRAEALSEAAYVPFTGQRLEGQTQEQKDITARVLAQQAPDQFRTGSGITGEAGLQALRAGEFAPGVFAAPLTQAQQLRQFQAQGPAGVQGGLSSFTGQGTAQEFMSPYMQNVVDVQKQEAIRDAQKGQLGQNLAAARQGTYGGARQTLAQTERERNLGQQLGQIQAAGSQAAFDAAQKSFEQEQARRLQAGVQTQQLGTQTALENLRSRLGVQQLGAQQSLEAQRANQQALMEAQKMREQSRQFGGELGVRGSQAATQAGATLGQLGIGQQQAFGQLSQLQASAAAQQQALRQRELDLAYQDFISQQQMPFKQLGFLSDILRGSASLTATGGKTVYEQQPSPLSSVVGPGLAALGAYREFGR